NFPTETTPLALYLLFYQIKNCVSKEPYAFLTYTVNITLPEELTLAINEYIHFYNHYRYQKRLNGLSPMEYRAKAA
ncbi:IS3 family transposase, partial [Metabacillus sp. 22489]|uniref:IS3 family transposase n=1 Tax=Metabacillus sp. 22489 TaxID=3453928 RepID=UPI003F860C6A